MIEIIPAILAKAEEEFRQRIHMVEPYVERVHIDIADGIFVPNTTIDGVKELRDLKTNVSLEIHLMVSRPERHITRWLETNADKFIFHIEASRMPENFISLVKEGKRSVWIALNPDTKTEEITPYLEILDGVQFMSVHPGFQGSPFEDAVLDNISDFHYLYPDIPIQADGGVTPQTAPKLAQAGAKILVSGSYIFKHENPRVAIEKLQKSIDN